MIPLVEEVLLVEVLLVDGSTENVDGNTEDVDGKLKTLLVMTVPVLEVDVLEVDVLSVDVLEVDVLAPGTSRFGTRLESLPDPPLVPELPPVPELGSRSPTMLPVPPVELDVELPDVLESAVGTELWTWAVATPDATRPASSTPAATATTLLTVLRRLWLIPHLSPGWANLDTRRVGFTERRVTAQRRSGYFGCLQFGDGRTPPC